LKILLVNPRYPDTFFSFRHALRFISKKAAIAPLGLLTVAAMLPDAWSKRLLDMNIKELTDADIIWADYVFISAMSIQNKSVDDVVKRCNRLNAKIVAGGPLFTTGQDQFKNIDHLVLNEAEVTLPAFLKDLETGQAKHVYTSSELPDISNSPIPLWKLADMKQYARMSVQYSRGCPYDCEFCDIVVLNGRKPRTKGKDQFLAELEALYIQGWRGDVFVVDDNFIGNKLRLKAEILPALIEWIEKRKHPFSFTTQASINLASDEHLMQQMVKAGFDTVFVGVETPNDESLSECGKQHNRDRDLIASIKRIQNYGMQVQGGFIVGFDNDPPSIFKTQINLIQNSGIVTAVVSLLNAPRGTKLYTRLKGENRLLENDVFGDAAATNIVPKMKYETLLNGYHEIINSIYSPKQHYKRINMFLTEYTPRKNKRFRPHSSALIAFLKILWVLGVRYNDRRYFWMFLFSTLLKRPRFFALSMTLAAYGFHFRKVMESYNNTLLGARSQIAP